MVEIAALYEVGDLGLYGELHLTDDRVVELHVYQNIVGPALESVLYAEYPEPVPLLTAQPLHLPEQPDDLLLLRRAATSHCVSDFEGQQVRGRGPECKIAELVLLVHLLRHLHQPMDQPVEVGDHVAVHISHHL